MFAELLVNLQKKETELQRVRKDIEDLINETDLKKYKDEYIRLKHLLDRDEERLHGISAQNEIKKNEISNLKLEKESCEIILNSDEVSSKKHEKIAAQVKKINEKLSTTKSQILKLNEESDQINDQLMDTKKRMIYIKRKFSEQKDIRNSSLNELKSGEKLYITEIDEISKQIGDEILDIYNKTKKVHANPLAYVEDKRCSGCNVEISTINMEHLKHNESIARCENCGRLLLTQ